MKKTFLISLIILLNLSSFSQQIKVAILDFENTSGIAKYDGLGKAMSSMLISDIESNVSPKRLQLVERAQIQKVLKEQSFQASSVIDKNTTVKAGKILGVKYLLVGDIYILNDVLIINARLTDTETGEIKFSKKQEGKLIGWLNLKTNIAKDLAVAFSMPFTEPTTPDKEVNVALITTFGNAVAARDTGNVQMAEKLAETVLEFSPDLKYADDFKKEINILKEQIKEQGQKIIVLEKSGGRIVNPQSFEDYLHNLKLSNYQEKDYREIFIRFFNRMTQAQIESESFFYGPKCFIPRSFDMKTKLETYQQQIEFLNNVFSVVDDSVLVKYCLPKALEYLEEINIEYRKIWGMDTLNYPALEGSNITDRYTKSKLLEKIGELDISGLKYIKLLHSKNIISKEFVNLVYEHSIFKYPYSIILSELLKQKNHAIDSLKQVEEILNNNKNNSSVYKPELVDSIRKIKSLITYYNINGLDLELHFVGKHSDNKIPLEICDFISNNQNYFNTLKLNNYVLEKNKICLPETQQIDFEMAYKNRANFKQYFTIGSSSYYPDNYKSEFLKFKPNSLDINILKNNTTWMRLIFISF
jgi:TolB-like protein